MDPSGGLEMSSSARENVFSRSSTQRNAEDDEESLKWAALQKLPTYSRMRTAIMKNIGADGKISQEEIDVRHLSYEDRQQIISKLLRVTEEDNERFLLKFRERIDRVGIVLPKIEVRFHHLNIQADVYVGNRALPTLPNFVLTLAEVPHLPPSLPPNPPTFTNPSIIPVIAELAQQSSISLHLSPQISPHSLTPPSSL
jgi:hypothetical protein